MPRTALNKLETITHVLIYCTWLTGLHKTQAIAQEVLYETKPRLSIAITHKAIMLHTKSKHELA